ncbi:DegQ family serine endoprotease [Thermithiobacillus plumbiphilus]|uniref:DegQ family serine endoprotease n=1 Tax=Thermithiobacillus plumbiphilus TaxID=1729899 RepID=UPI003BFA2AE1
MVKHRAQRLWPWSWALSIIFLLSAFRAAHAADLPDFTSLVEQNGPAVVNISTTQTIKAPQAGPGMPQGTPFDDFFRHFFGDVPNAMPREYKAQSLGSGFIISHDGYVVTNAHVIQNADKVDVRLTDRRQFEAKVIGKDERTDIALLKIPGNNLPVVRIGDPEKVKVGAWVAAIGAPFGFENSVTSGIVGAKGRSIPNESYVPFIQTDVAINPGNSGGPLFNMDGEVIGVNSMIYSRTGGFMGLSFSIPIDIAMRVVNELRTTGKVSHGWLGVMVQDITEPLARSFNLPNARGALVGDVMPDSPAAKAGIRRGDVIVSFAGRDINVSGDLPPLVGMAPVGKPVQARLLRNGQTLDVNVVIEEMPKKPGEMASSAQESDRLGVRVDTLTAEQKRKLKVSGGLLVTAVAPGPAADAGIRPGDVIVQLARQPVGDVAQFQRLVAGLPRGQPIPVLVNRGGGSLYLALQLDK